MGKHSTIGPSSCEQFWNCPASVSLQEGLPEQSSGYADEGSNAHALAALCLKNKRSPLGYVDEEMEENGRVWTVTEEMAEAVNVYYKTVWDTVKREGCIKLEVEKELSNPDIDPDAFGTCDCYFRSTTGKIFIFDYKHGKGVSVDAENNRQMMYYAALSMDYVLAESVVLTIVQPRAKDDHNAIKQWEAKSEQIDTFKNELQDKIKETRVKKPKTVTGKWCRFCRAKFKCPAFTQTLSDLFPEESSKELAVNLPLDKYGAMYARAVVFKDKFDTWFKQLSELLYSYAEAGTPAPGTKLVMGRKTRKWEDEAAAESALAEYGDKIYTPRKLKSPAQMEKVVDKETVAELVTETAPLKLALDSDNREAVQSIEQLFEVIED